MMATAYPRPTGAAVDWHSGGGDRRLDRAAYRLRDESGTRFWPEIVHLVRRVGQYRHDRGRDIPYFIVPIIAPLLGACLGAAIYRFLIANNLPCHTCVEEENTR